MGNHESHAKEPAQESAFEAIPDQYETMGEVQSALRKAGLESSNLIIGIDYTKSNHWNGENSFNGRSLHEIDPKGFSLNPYQRVIMSIGQALRDFDEDEIIPTFGFGDLHTKGNSCFSFTPGTSGCHGFQEVLQRYNEITPSLRLAGPTNFAPVIREAIQLVHQQGGLHISDE